MGPQESDMLMKPQKQLGKELKTGGEEAWGSNSALPAPQGLRVQVRRGQVARKPLPALASHGEPGFLCD